MQPNELTPAEVAFVRALAIAHAKLPFASDDLKAAARKAVEERPAPLAFAQMAAGQGEGEDAMKVETWFEIEWLRNGRASTLEDARKIAYRGERIVRKTLTTEVME